jgi:hypothetical protein
VVGRGRHRPQGSDADPVDLIGQAAIAAASGDHDRAATALAEAKGRASALPADFIGGVEARLA